MRGGGPTVRGPREWIRWPRFRRDNPTAHIQTRLLFLRGSSQRQVTCRKRDPTSSRRDSRGPFLGCYGAPKISRSATSDEMPVVTWRSSGHRRHAKILLPLADNLSTWAVDGQPGTRCLLGRLGLGLLRRAHSGPRPPLYRPNEACYIIITLQIIHLRIYANLFFLDYL